MSGTTDVGADLSESVDGLRDASGAPGRFDSDGVEGIAAVRGTDVLRFGTAGSEPRDGDADASVALEAVDASVALEVVDASEKGALGTGLASTEDKELEDGKLGADALSCSWEGDVRRGAAKALRSPSDGASGKGRRLGKEDEVGAAVAGAEVMGAAVAGAEVMGAAVAGVEVSAEGAVAETLCGGRWGPARKLSRWIAAAAWCWTNSMWGCIA